MSLLSAPRAEAVRLIREQLSCMLCGKIFEDPQCLDCKHNFCRDCILGHLRQNNTQCPRCQLPTQPSEVTRNQFLESILAAWKAVESELAQLLGDPQGHEVPVTVQDTDAALYRALGGSSVSFSASAASSGDQNGSAKAKSAAEAEVTTMQGRGRVANNKWHIDTQEIRHELRIEQRYYPQYRGQHANGSGSSHAKTSSSDLPDDYSGSSSRQTGQSGGNNRSNGTSNGVTSANGTRREAGGQKKPARESLAEASAVQAKGEAEGEATSEPPRREQQLKSEHSRASEDSVHGGGVSLPAASQSSQLEESSSQSSSLMATQEVESYLERISKQREALSQWERSRKQDTRAGSTGISVMERAMRSGMSFADMLGVLPGQRPGGDGDDGNLMTQMSTTASALESPDLLASFHTSTRRHRGPRRIQDKEDEGVDSDGSGQRPADKTKRRVELSSPLYSGRKRLRVPSSDAGDGGGGAQDAPVIKSEPQDDGGIKGEDEYEMKPAVPLVLASEPKNSPSPDLRREQLGDLCPPASTAQDTGSADSHGSLSGVQTNEKPREDGTKGMNKWLVPSAMLKPGASLNATMTRAPTASPARVSNSKASSSHRSPQSYVFVGTDISREEIKRVLEACQRLGGKFGRDFDLRRDAKTGSYSTSVTHLITKSVPHLDEFTGDANEPRCKRTAKYMRALAEGCFVVDFGWVLASLRAGKWVSETRFEMAGDIYSDSVGKPREARLRRRQTGRRNDILSMFRFVVLVSEEEFGFQFASVRSLVETFGGRVAREDDFADLKGAKRQRRTPIGVVSKVTSPATARTKWQQHRMPIVRVTWLFDSISHLEVLPFDDYYPY